MAEQPCIESYSCGMWQYTGKTRPPFAECPGDGQESVWDYPRPPRLVADARDVVVCIGDTELIRTRSALRLLETASPPTFYLPFSDAAIPVRTATPAVAGAHCEWKGAASYGLGGIAWWYAHPSAPYEALAEYFSVYPSRAACFVDGERVRPQPGDFYGGWVTSEICGPWKGGRGSGGW